MFIQNAPSSVSASTFYIFSTVAIPSDTSLVVDGAELPVFDNSEGGYGLYLTVGASDTLDVLISPNTLTI